MYMSIWLCIQYVAVIEAICFVQVKNLHCFTGHIVGSFFPVGYLLATSSVIALCSFSAILGNQAKDGAHFLLNEHKILIL